MITPPSDPKPAPILFKLFCPKCNWRVEWVNGSGDPWPTTCYDCGGRQLKPVPRVPDSGEVEI